MQLWLGQLLLLSSHILMIIQLTTPKEFTWISKWLPQWYSKGFSIQREPLTPNWPSTPVSAISSFASSASMDACIIISQVPT